MLLISTPGQRAYSGTVAGKPGHTVTLLIVYLLSHTVLHHVLPEAHSEPRIWVHMIFEGSIPRGKEEASWRKQDREGEGSHTRMPFQVKSQVHPDVRRNPGETITLQSLSHLPCLPTLAHGQPPAESSETQVQAPEGCEACRNLARGQGPPVYTMYTFIYWLLATTPQRHIF